MPEEKHGSVDPSIFENIKSHLEGLKRTPDGAVLYSLIARGLKRFGIDDGGIELAFVTFLYSVLGRYAIDPTSHPVTRMKARLLQQRLVPYLPENEPLPEPAVDLDDIGDTTQTAKPPTPAPESKPPDPETQTVQTKTQQPELPPVQKPEPVEPPSGPAAPVDAMTIDFDPPPAIVPADAVPTVRQSAEPARFEDISKPVTAKSPSKDETAPPSRKKENAHGQKIERTVEKPTPSREAPPSVEFISKSETVPAKEKQKPAASAAPPPPPKEAIRPAKREPLVREPEVVDYADLVPESGQTDSNMTEKLEGDFLEKLSEAVTHNEEIDGLLRQTLLSLQRTQTAQGLGMMKQMLVAGLQELIQGRSKLSENLRGTDKFMVTIRREKQQLQDTVRKLRKHSVADELTGLPNRSFFIRQLEAELSRAKRYGFSLAVAIMDVDNFKAVNERYGRETGDEILRCYASEILSMFRGYDMVARYDDDEFAALFPNTQKDGAIRALEKAQKRAAETYITYNGKSIPLPTFSSVLTLYTPGEKPETLLKRADQALSHAKQRGANRVVVALPAG